MSKAIIDVSDKYKLHISCERVEALPGHWNLEIKSQWLDAKDPDELRTLFSSTMKASEALKIASTIFTRLAAEEVL